MNAHKFVAEKGIDEAKRVLSQAKPDSKIYDLISNQYHKSRVTAIPVGCSMYPTYRAVEVKEFIVLSELKQVVESVEIVDRLFGLDQAKHTMVIAKEIGFTSDYEQIKQAIADHELVESYKQVKVEVSFGIALQNNQSVGAKCEVLDMVDVSPSCEVINEAH